MSASFCFYVLTWWKGRILDWQAGFDYISTLTEDDLFDYPYTQESLTDNLTELKEIIESGGVPDDVSIIEIAHLYCLVTGGMTWGDDPSHAFSIISNLETELSILQRVGFWQDDIDYKEILMKIIKAKKNDLPTLIGLDKNLDDLIGKEFKK